MKVPTLYIAKSLIRRLGSTVLTMSSFGLVVFSLVMLLAMVEGVNNMLIASGAADRVLAFNENVNNENQSQLSLQDVRAIKNHSAVKLTPAGQSYASAEIVTTAYAMSPLGERIQTNFRGVTPADARLVHNELQIVAGRFFNPDAEDEVILGRQMYEAMGIYPGARFEAQQVIWRAVGVFEDGGSTAESEIWTAAANIAHAYNKKSVSSVWILVTDPAQTEQVVQQLNSDPLISVYAATEADHYAQGFATARGLQILAWIIAGIMAAGAIFSAMNTMYASIADRSGELAALRAIGFQPQSVLIVVLTEAFIVAMTGGMLACLLGWALNGAAIRTVLPGLGTVAFQFKISRQLLFVAMGFSGFLGIIGGWIPARFAIKMNIVQALNS